MPTCQICQENFELDKGLHLHLKKHGTFQADYYCQYYPRLSLHYKRLIPFKNKEDYFKREFIDYKEVLAWLDFEKSKAADKALDLVRGRLSVKNYQYGLFSNELRTLCLPPIKYFKENFGTYGAALKKIGKEPLFNMPLPPEFSAGIPNFTLLVDTREQDPLEFEQTVSEKLYVGDYLIKGHHAQTFVDRKSEGDFLGTMASGVERFEREIIKSVDLDCYLWVVIESSIDQIYRNKERLKFKTSLDYVFHNMRELTHKYPRRVQFVFTGSRPNSVKLIPKLLYHGKALWQVDMQYFLDSAAI